MSVYTGIDPRQRREIVADVAQLVQPIYIAVRGRIVTHPALLDQLRAAIAPGSVVRGAQRRRAPGSRPAASLGPLEALGTITDELSAWHHRQRLPPVHAVDWHKAALVQLVHRAPDLAPPVADWLATDVHDWWRLAATEAGWRTQDLLRVR